MARLSWATRLSVSGIVMPVASYIGITETRSEVDGIEKKRDVNGGTCVLRPLWGRKFKIALSASGAAVRWIPAFEALPKDQVVELHSTLHMTFGILPGQPSATLIRSPVPGSVKLWVAADPDQRPLPFTAIDRLVSPTVPFTEPLSGCFLPIHFVTRNSSTSSGAEIAGVVDWQTEFEEA